jgi:hypothetical protein
MSRTVLKDGAARVAAGKPEEERAVITLTVSRRLAWGLRMYAKGREMDLGELCEPHLEAIVQGKRIPWAWYQEILDSERTEAPSVTSQEIQVNPEVQPTETGETKPPALLESSAKEAGGGEGEAQPPARPKLDPAAARAKIQARRERKSA